MTTALDAPVEELDEDERSFVASIREHGWFRTCVAGDEEGPGFSYTTGFLLATGQPEVIVFSLKSEAGHNLLWNLFDCARDGDTLPVGVPVADVIDHWNVYLFPVAQRHYREHLGWSRWFYGNDQFPCLQLVWPDAGGIFPWEDGFNEDLRNDQPDLTEAGWTKELAQ